MIRPLPLSSWPVAQRAGITGLITDIDDTLTLDGQLMPEARAALEQLQQAGVAVLAVTGRPVGWSLRLLAAQARGQGRPWPLLGIVAENGAVALRAHADGSVEKLYRTDAATRQSHYARLQAALEEVERHMPQARRSRDSEGRETDIAIDHSEFEKLSADEIAQVVQRLQGHGLRVTVSSIHINAWLGDHDKWVGACWAVQAWLNRLLPSELDHWVYVGDSSNDEVMFRQMRYCVGVANLAPFLPQLAHAPGYICQAERGAGFAELVHALLQARAQHRQDNQARQQD